MQISNQIGNHLLSMNPNIIKSNNIDANHLFLNHLLGVSPESLSETGAADQTADMHSTVGALDGTEPYDRQYTKTISNPMRLTSVEAYDRQYTKNPVHPVRLHAVDI